MKKYEELKEMFGLAEDEELWITDKGTVAADQVVITEDYRWSEAAGMLDGHELECYAVLRDSKELTEEEYNNFRFTYKDEREKYTETGEEYGIDRSYPYINDGIDLTDCEVYILYNYYNNNEVTGYILNAYKIA